MTQERPVRKQMRLETWDYSTNGYYYVTICIEQMRCILGFVRDGVPDVPQVYACECDCAGVFVDRCPEVCLSRIGSIVQRRLLEMDRVYPDVEIDQYCIMPNHVHLVLMLRGEAPNGTSAQPSGASRTPGGASRTPGGTSRTPSRTNNRGGRANERIPAWVSTFKRFTNRKIGTSIWHRSYYDHIIRTEEDYLRICQYIAENPSRWLEDEYYRG